MQEQSDLQLLRDYAEHGHESAFREIVSRHADVVYASALRQAGSPDLAQDIAQNVFTDLARKARSLADTLNGDAALLGWLYRSTRFAALNQLRDNRRRTARERLAMQHLESSAETAPEWEHVQPVLDEAMAELSDEDREALLLRFFKDRDFRAIGAALGISDDAAQKRVSRALERLRASLASRGVTTTAGALSALLVAETVSFAPAGLAATLSTAALAGTTLATAATATATTMNWINIKSVAAIVATALVAGTGTYFVQQREATRLRSENQNMIAEKQRLTNERDAAISAARGTRDELEGLGRNQNDLLRLRGEVAMLRSQSNQLDSLRKENARLQQLAQLKGVGNQGTNELPVVAKIIVTRIKQPQLISEEQIRAQILVKVGDIFNRAAVDLDVRNLSGLFHSLRVADSMTDEGVILNYMLQEKPKLTGIRFAGTTKYRDADFNQLLVSKVGEALDERTIYNDAQKLQELYKASGFPGTYVKSVVNINEDVGEGDVVFEIRE